MKITDGQHRTAPTSPVSPTSRTTERDAANASVEDGSPVRVTLSDRALALASGRVEGVARGEDTIDAAKVERLKAAIESGSFVVNAQFIAAQILRGG